MPAASSETWHVVTCEFPPQLGGVADFTGTIARALAAAGKEVHVWAPAPAQAEDTVCVHSVPGAYGVGALRALDRALTAHQSPRRLFVQWVPHGYGYKSLNVPFCLWVRRRAVAGDQVDVMVHEPFLPFDRRRPRQNVGAIIHRLMLATLLRAASRVWVSTPSFTADVARFCGRPADQIRWLPVPSPIEPVRDDEAVAALRAQLAEGAPLVAHFGTCNALVAPVLERVIAAVRAHRPDARFALAGRGTNDFAERIVAAGLPAASIVTRGPLDSRRLSLLLQAADVFVQPYPDGVSSRRTTLMALLQHGRAVIASSGPRTEPYWSESQAVVLTGLDDPEAMGRAAVDLIGNPDGRRELGRRAQACYARTFDISCALAVLLGNADGARRSPERTLSHGE